MRRFSYCLKQREQTRCYRGTYKPVPPSQVVLQCILGSAGGNQMIGWLSGVVGHQVLDEAGCPQFVGHCWVSSGCWSLLGVLRLSVVAECCQVIGHPQTLSSVLGCLQMLPAIVWVCHCCVVRCPQVSSGVSVCCPVLSGLLRTVQEALSLQCPHTLSSVVDGCHRQAAPGVVGHSRMSSEFTGCLQDSSVLCPRVLPGFVMDCPKCSGGVLLDKWTLHCANTLSLDVVGHR